MMKYRSILGILILFYLVAALLLTSCAADGGGSAEKINPECMDFFEADNVTPEHFVGATWDTVMIDWSEIIDATEYQVTVVDADGIETVEVVDAPPYSLSNLEDGKTYTYTVHAKSSACAREKSSNEYSFTPSNPCKIFDQATTPTATATVGDVWNQYSIQWDSVVSADYYQVFIDANQYVVQNPPYIMDNAQHNQQYIYKVIANKEGCSPKISNEDMFQPINPVPCSTFYEAPNPTPHHVKLEKWNNFQIVWDAVEGAESYDLVKDGTVIPNVTSPYDMFGLFTSTIYTYKVVANKNSISCTPKESEEISFSIHSPCNDFNASDFVAEAVTTASWNQYEITWNVVNNAESYDVFVADTDYLNVTSPFVVPIDLYDGDVVFFKVYANKEDCTRRKFSGKITVSNPCQGVNLANSSMAPAVDVFTTWDTFSISWNTVDDPDVTYDVVIGGDRFSNVTTPFHDTVALEGFVQCDSFTYSVTAKKDGCDFISSDDTTFTVTEPGFCDTFKNDVFAAPTLMPNGWGYTISWLPVVNATSYDVVYGPGSLSQEVFANLVSPVNTADLLSTPPAPGNQDVAILAHYSCCPPNESQVGTMVFDQAMYQDAFNSTGTISSSTACTLSCCVWWMNIDGNWSSLYEPSYPSETFIFMAYNTATPPSYPDNPSDPLDDPIGKVSATELYAIINHVSSSPTWTLRIASHYNSVYAYRDIPFASTCSGCCCNCC